MTPARHLLRHSRTYQNRMHPTQGLNMTDLLLRGKFMRSTIAAVLVAFLAVSCSSSSGQERLRWRGNFDQMKDRFAPWNFIGFDDAIGGALQVASNSERCGDLLGLDCENAQLYFDPDSREVVAASFFFSRTSLPLSKEVYELLGGSFRPLMLRSRTPNEPESELCVTNAADAHTTKHAFNMEDGIILDFAEDETNVMSVHFHRDFVGSNFPYTSCSDYESS